MPNRIIREAILSSEAIAQLDFPAEVFYRRVMSIVDDYGRHEANLQLLRSLCYPLQTDDVRVADITRWMAACQKAGVIVLYEVAGKRYLEVTKFQQQQRSASKCPPPPADANSCNHLLADAHLGVSVVDTHPSDAPQHQDATGSVPAKPKNEKAKVESPRGARLPADWVLPKAWGEWALAERGDWTDRHVRQVAALFRDHWVPKTGKDATKADWLATWRNWVRNQKPFVLPPTPGTVGLSEAGQKTVTNLADWHPPEERNGTEG